MQGEHIIGFIILGFIIYTFFRWLTHYHSNSMESTSQKKVESNPQDNSQESTKQGLINEIRAMEENEKIVNEYAAFLQRKEGLGLICSEEDLPYSKEKIKKALLMQAACMLVNSEDEEADERIPVYQTAFMELGKFIVKEDALAWQTFMDIGEKAQKKELNKEEMVKIAEGILDSKVDFKKCVKEVEESRKKLKIEWDFEMMKHVSWYATVKKMSQNS